MFFIIKSYNTRKLITPIYFHTYYNIASIFYQMIFFAIKAHYMKLLKLLFYSFIFNNCFILLASASNDTSYCNFSLSLTNKNNDICSNLPFLSPYNDSRTNLVLLIDNPNIQRSILRSLSSPQNKAPYLTDDIRKNVARIPFEFTIYDAYLDEVEYTNQLKINKIKKQIDEKTKHLILHVMKNESLLNNNDFLSSPALSFIEQISKTHGLNKQERKDLFSARYLLFDNPTAEISSFINNNASFTAQHFINYLQGISHFYKKDYDKALKYFTEASTASQPWVKETALYMIARTLLNKGQNSAFNHWYEIDLNKVNQPAITQSYYAFTNYLKKYPAGNYAHSAHALLRRTYWLNGNRFALTKSYETLLNKINSVNNYADLILEIDNKIYFNKQFKSAYYLSKTPKLLAVYDLLRMRTNQLSEESLINHEKLFKNYPTLYILLQATYYTYNAPNPEKVLLLSEQIKNTHHSNASIEFSIQVLRAIALENTGQWLAAENLWKNLNSTATYPYQSALVELGLALNYEKTNRINSIFDKDSFIKTPQLRYILLRKNANREQLKQLLFSEGLNVTEKSSTLYLILYKDLLSQHYDDFLEDTNLLTSNQLDTAPIENISLNGKAYLTLFSEPIPSHPEYPCPSPIILANILKLNPKEARSLNCLAEFRQFYKLPYNHYMLPLPIDMNELGTNNPTAFGQYLYSPLKGYQLVIDDKNASEEDKAYALYKAIRCFASTGYNQCDKQIIPQTKRKEWFQQLHTKYAKTTWAKQQSIYW